MIDYGKKFKKITHYGKKFKKNERVGYNPTLFVYTSIVIIKQQGAIDMNNFNPNNIDREKILERKYFHQLPRKTQRELMAYWRETFPTSVIRERMGYNSGTAFYNLLKRLKLPTNVQRVRVDDFDYTEDVPVIQDENPINTINSVMGKNLENESNFEVRVSIFGEVNVSIHDLPNLVLEAHEKGFELEIKEVIEEVNQPLFRG